MKNSLAVIPEVFQRESSDLGCLSGQAVYILCKQAKWHPVHGVTSDLPKHVWEHKNELVEGSSMSLFF